MSWTEDRVARPKTVCTGGTCTGCAGLMAIALAALIAAAWPSHARAHGDQLLLVALLPAVGAEVQTRQEHARRDVLLLSWPVQFPFGEDRSYQHDPVHRIVVSPELRLGGGSTEVGGRVGYRWNTRFFFTGLGVSASDSLTVCGSPELGVRYFSEGDLTRFFVVARADVPVTSEFGRRWAASLSLGLALF